ncbi:MAG TPA: hypothetical protein PLO51_05635 [Candidatus Micrarchaeota archaeon]|nr:hypothetical protein [Candidatus Micrarchaeota archaeon]
MSLQIHMKGQISAEFMAMIAIAALFFLVVSSALISSRTTAQENAARGGLGVSASSFCANALQAIQNPGEFVIFRGFPSATNYTIRQARIDFSGNGDESHCVIGTGNLMLVSGWENGSIQPGRQALVSDSSGRLEVIAYG